MNSVQVARSSLLFHFAFHGGLGLGLRLPGVTGPSVLKLRAEKWPGNTVGLATYAHDGNDN